MKSLILISCLFLSHFLYAQTPTVYPEFEVQQPAEPQGGMDALNRFLAVNIQKPFLAQVADKKGMVFLQAVVEPDGRVSNVKVIRSLRPDCDREAVRAFSLFNAWKPARKDGQAVRQLVNLPVRFDGSEPVRYENGVAIRYYTDNFQLVNESDAAVVLRSEIPTDTLGLPTGDLVFYRKKGANWKQETAMTLTQTKPMISDGVSQRSLFHIDNYGRRFGSVYTLNADNLIVAEEFYNLDRKKTLSITRNRQGMVVSTEVSDAEQTLHKTWYDNGQIRSYVMKPVFELMKNTTKPEQMLAFWDQNGQQIISEGNGNYVATDRQRSAADTSRYTTFTEQGLYERGVKQGRWTGRSDDGSYSYIEQYDKGKLLEGKAVYADEADTLRYTTLAQQPEFDGGLQGLGQFLANRLHYPADAQRARVEGRVFVTFVVNTDGTLSDVTVLKGIHPAADEEAVRVARAMSGRWKPGYQRGRPVRVKYNLPINFSLQ